MAIPINDRQEFPVSSVGTESEPQGVIVKNSLWTVQISYHKLLLKEYSGYFVVIENLRVNKFRLTQALKNDLSVDTDRIWIWVTDLNNNLSLYEYEPYTTESPVQTYNRLNIYTGVNEFDVYIKELNPVRITCTDFSGNALSLALSNVRDLDPPVVGSLEWGPTRLSSIANYINEDRTLFDVMYLDVNSPPNLYTDSYSIPVPTNLSVINTVGTNVVTISWNASIGADSYLIERDTSPSFSAPNFFINASTTYIDNVPTTGTFYYRVRALDSTLYLQSLWSTTESVELILEAEFIGDPLGGPSILSVTFTDQSTPTGLSLSYDWDFGDGSPHSVDQNPIHDYTDPGIYTVILTISDGVYNASRTRLNYITVAFPLIADFLADPSSGDANLIVNFTDQSLGSPISWEWDFGDGSPHSFVRNPVHVYFIAGVHSVTLTVSDGTYTVATSKNITVNMVADFITDVVSGYADLTVNFTDTSWGTPTSWYWDFGDGSYSTEQNPAHTYTTPGHFTVSLTVSRDPGTGAYTDTIVQTDLLSVYTKAEFSGSPRIGYQNLLVQFVDESKGEPTSWYWDFGDESFSEEQNPSHEYKSPGEYTVVLTAASFFNSDIETKKKYIIVEGTATPDIAPEPDILLYTDGQVKVNKEKKGIRIVYLKNSSSY